MNHKPRGILIAGNWKMNHGPKETAQFFSKFSELHSALFKAEAKALLTQKKLRACILPPDLSLNSALTAATSAPFSISIGAQNVHWEKKGAFTGEISGPMLQEMGVHWALVGHSERRQYFGETDLTVQKRTQSLLEQGFQVIVCIGETRQERESGKTVEVLLRQLSVAIPSGSPASNSLKGTLIIAYEPVWAIGTGLTASPEQAEAAHQCIRDDLQKRFGQEAAQKTPLLYGGSVTPENAKALLSSPNIDGALVGGASLKPEGFLAILQAGAENLG